MAADQAVKALVRDSIERGDAVDLILGIELVNVRNSGIAFGMFTGGGVLLVIFALAALAALLVFFFTPPRPAAGVAADRPADRRRGRQPDRPRRARAR